MNTADSIRPDRLSPTSYVVLGTIALRGPSTPYDLKRAVGHSIGYFWPFPHAQLYSEPKRLADLGLLAVTSENAGRRRQVYDITAAGLAAVRAWLAEPTNEQMQVRDIAEMKLFFSELARPEDIRALAGQQIEQHRRRIAAYEAMMERFAPRPELSGRLIPLRLGLRIEYAALEFWTDFHTETKFKFELSITDPRFPWRAQAASSPAGAAGQAECIASAAAWTALTMPR